MSEDKPNLMEIGQADLIEIQKDRHNRPREVRVISVNLETEEITVEYPGTSLDGGGLFTDIRDTATPSDVLRVVE